MTIFVPTTKNFQSIRQNPCNRMESIANNNSATTTTMEGIVTMIPEKTFIDSTGRETLPKNHNKQENGNNQNHKGHQSNLGDASDNQEKNILAESLVETTILITNVIWCNFPLLPNVQVIPLRLYIQETLKRSRTSLSTLQTALLYLLRIKPKIGSIYLNLSSTSNSTSNSNLNSSSNSSSNSNPNIINIDSATCGRRMFLASLIVASKYLQDNNYSNNAWSKISGLSLKEINSIERRFLQLIVYNLYVSEEVFNNWTNLLNSHIKTILNNNDSPNDNNNNNNNNNNKGNSDNNSNIDNKSNYSNDSNVNSNFSNNNINNNNSGNRGNQIVDNHKRKFFMINSSTTTISSKECEVKG